ncbi:hypothetical protein ACQCSX_14540 [Pseudarthrobacter sp. P1]|uniref:hypothetical protein n=1 Tax=Pseudarthrobacter sp. P1 TaxID=3418418 RepID=UPI003CF5BA22
MASITWFAPILPGKLDTWRAFTEEMYGPRLEEYQRSRARLGFTREVASLTQTSEGDFVCLFHEADDLGAAFTTLAQSDDPFDVWFRENLVDTHGLTPEMLQGPPPATLTHDYSPAGS